MKEALDIIGYEEWNLKIAEEVIKESDGVVRFSWLTSGQIVI